jgi:hypothetical protein
MSRILSISCHCCGPYCGALAAAVAAAEKRGAVLSRLPGVRQEWVDRRLQDAVGAAEAILYPLASAACQSMQFSLGGCDIDACGMLDLGSVCMIAKT